ncbi:hypothetical protein Xoosp13_23 [Xanthomonas phage Xoo-sp13]|nr:hypothetical protein Xoosp13_23 [Xanthomonas phage Xoo-sp13]
MNTITIYRVQNDNNVGPFRDGSTPDEVRMVLTSSIPDLKYHPLIGRDVGLEMGGLGNKNRQYCCGTESIRQLRHWFPSRETVEVLQSMNMHIYAYTIDADLVKFGKSGTQVAFIPADATSFKKISVSRLLTKAMPQSMM